MTELLKSTCIVDVAATGFKVAHKTWEPCSVTTHPGCFYGFFGKIRHSMDSEECACGFRATPEFLHVVRTSIERRFLPTLAYLHQEVSADARYLTLWLELGKVLGITEATVRMRHRLDRRCGNLACPARISGPQAQKRYVCIQCDTTYYCDRTCQTGYSRPIPSFVYDSSDNLSSDWHYHKKECKMLRLANSEQCTPTHDAAANA